MRIHVGCALALCFLFANNGVRGDWEMTTSEKEVSPNELAEHWTTRVTDATAGRQATLNLALFNSQLATLRVIDQAQPPRQDLAAAITGTNAVAGVNGGYFDPADAPVGLLISDGRLLSPLRKAKLLTGILFANANRVDVVRASQFSMKEKPRTAVQCGPLLIDHAEPVAGLNDSRSARRTFAAVDGKGRTILGISSSVSLAQLSQILRLTNLADRFKVARALNLDGGSSTAFWFAGNHGPVSFPEQKTVRDFVIVVPRAEGRN
jgi:uncharacterized protein YigE (DUF2233 family)